MPPNVAAPAEARGGLQRRHGGVVQQVDDDHRSRIGGSGSISPSGPTGVAFTMRSASTSRRVGERHRVDLGAEPVDRRPQRRRCGPDRARRPSGSPRRRAARASAHARAAPPAPKRSARPPRRIEARVVAEEPVEPGRVGVVAEEGRAVDHERVHRPETARVLGQRVGQLRGDLLCGMVTFAPANPSAADPLERADPPTAPPGAARRPSPARGP